MLKLMRNRSPCALLSTTSSSFVSIARKLLSSCDYKAGLIGIPGYQQSLLSCGQVVIYADYPRLTALKRTTMVIAAKSEMLAPANVASVRSLPMMRQTINVEQTKIAMLTQLTSYMRLA